MNKRLDNQALVDMETERGSALETAVKHLTTEDAIILLDKLESNPKPEIFPALRWLILIPSLRGLV